MAARHSSDNETEELLRLNPLALVITAIFASVAQATSTPLCSEVLAGIQQVGEQAPAKVKTLTTEWRRWLQTRVVADTSDSAERWVFALRSWNKLTVDERRALSGEIAQALANWEPDSLDSLRKSIDLYQAEIEAAESRLTPYLEESNARVRAATDAVTAARPGPQPGLWARLWDRGALGAWEQAVAKHEDARRKLQAADGENASRTQLQKRLAETKQQLTRMSAFVESLKTKSTDATAHPALQTQDGDANDQQTLALLTVLFLNEAVRRVEDVDPMRDAWADFTQRREELRKALIDGQVAIPALPAPIQTLFATDADIVALELRLKNILDSAGIEGTELEARLEGATPDTRDAELEAYFGSLRARVPHGQLAALADLVASVKTSNAKELASIRTYLAENKVTRRNARSRFAKVKEQSKRASELVNHQMRVLKLEHVLFVLRQAPRTNAGVAVAPTSRSFSATPVTATSTTSDDFTYFYLWWLLLHDSSSHGIDQAAHYTVPNVEVPAGDAPVGAEAPAADAPFQPVGDDFGGAQPGDFVPQDDGSCAIGTGGDFAPQLDTGLSLSGSTDSGTLDFSQSVDWSSSSSDRDRKSVV